MNGGCCKEQGSEVVDQSREISFLLLGKNVEKKKKGVEGVRKRRFGWVRSSIIAGGGVCPDDRGTTGTVEVHKSRARLAIEELAEKRPALLEAPIAYLQVYLSDGQNRERTLQRSPILYFALAQCSLSYRYICTRLQKRTLKAVMLRECMVNLISLIRALGRTHPEIYEPVADQLQKFIAVLEDLDRQLAELSGIISLNWQTISSVLKTTVHSHKQLCDSRSFSEFVPSIDDFTPLKLLGRGAFGAVYKALFKDELEVAVKLVPQQRFRNDPKGDTPFMDKMVGAVIPNHPYICRIYCSFIASIKEPSGDQVNIAQSNNTISPTCSPMGVSVTVMEAIDGMDLTELVGKNVALSFNLTQIIMQQLMMAIEHLHLCGFVHRDIKPANMLVMRDGRIKLIDFDVNRVCISHFGNQHQMSYFNRTASEFSSGDKAGTEAYMAPEVHQNKPFGRASDWWSVGIVHFRLIYGRLPFRSQQLAEQIINQDIEWDKVGLSSDPQMTTMKNYLSKLLVKNPRERLGSRDYSDIFDHPLFVEVNWQRLPEQTVWCEELDAAFAERPSNNESEKATMKPAYSNKEDPMHLSHLTDNLRDHLPLMTYSSRMIKRMVTGDAGPGESEDIPRWRHITEFKKVAEDTTGGTTMAEQKQRKEPVQVIIQEYGGTRGIFTSHRRNISLRRYLCEDGNFRYMVNDISPGVKIISEAKLYQGDLVLEVDKTSLTNLSESRVANLLMKRGSPIVLSVAQENPFRDAGEATFNISQLLYRFKPIKVPLKGEIKPKPCLSLCWTRPHMIHGFTLTVRKVYSAGAAELVCFIDTHDLTKQKPPSAVSGRVKRTREENNREHRVSINAFTGDVVLAINGSRLEQLARTADPEKQIKGLIKSSNVELDLIPCSPFRLSNLPANDANAY